ncbi:MAG: ATP-binding protein, partial [Planctomycetia bacterium]|nr:ATP-binding protein [Planctomycetia bacterium]
MNRKLLTPYGLKFNPFSAQIPVEALWSSPVIGQFCWRLEQQLGEGGFALISGVSGSGKSATLRLLQSRLANQREVTVGVLSRPQAALADFYRELGDLFGVPLRPHNRWASAKALRERWLQHIDTSLVRPVLLVDEAQEMHAAVLSELRLLTSAELDSRSILTVVLAGDDRLCTQLELPELVPLASRIRTQTRNGGTRELDYVAWLSMPKATFTASDPLVGPLQALNLMSVGAIEKAKDGTSTVEP